MGMTAVPKSNVAAASEEDASSVNADLQRVYDLKATFQQRQDVRTTQDAINTLVAILQKASTGNIVARNAFNTLVAILSNVQAKSHAAESVNDLYRLLTTGHPKPLLELHDVHLVARLKIFDLATAKSSQKPDKHDLEAIVFRLAEACFFGARIEAQEMIQRRTAAPTSRVYATMPVSSTMGNFALDARPPSSRRAPGRKSSISSISSRRSNQSALSESETSDSDASHSSLRDSAAVRSEGLRALASLAKLDTRALHPFWPLFFSPSAKPSLLSLAQNDLSLTVRLQGIQTTKVMLVNSNGYLDLARESKTNLAYTPLSVTLANIANDLNTQTIQLLRSVFILPRGSGLLVPALQLASVVIAQSPYDRLARPYLDDIACIVLEEIARTYDAACLEAISAVLTTIAQVQAASKALSQSTSKLAGIAVQETFERIQSGTEVMLQVRLWAILSVLLKLSSSLSTTRQQCADIVQSVHHTFLKTSKDVQEQQLQVVSVIAHTGPMPVNGLDAVLNEILQEEASIVDSNVKSKLAALLVTLPTFLLEHLDGVMNLLASLARQQQKETRIQAFRSIGTVLQSSVAYSNATLQENCFRILMDGTGPPTSVAIRAEAFWNLANAVEGLSGESIPPTISRPLLEAAEDQVNIDGASRDAEMIRTSCIRISGTLLLRLSSIDVILTGKTKASLNTALIEGSPKIQWNAAVAMKKVITADIADRSILHALFNAYEASDNSKVKHSISAALQAFDERASQYSTDLILEIKHWKERREAILDRLS